MGSGYGTSAGSCTLPSCTSSSCGTHSKSREFGMGMGVNSGYGSTSAGFSMGSMSSSSSATGMPYNTSGMGGGYGATGNMGGYNMGGSCTNSSCTSKTCATHSADLTGATMTTRVLPTVHLEPQVLPVERRTETLAPEVIPVERRTVERLIQPIEKEIIKPVEVNLQKPIIHEERPVHTTIVQPVVQPYVREEATVTTIPLHKNVQTETVMNKVTATPEVRPATVIVGNERNLPMGTTPITFGGTGGATQLAADKSTLSTGSDKFSDKEKSSSTRITAEHTKTKNT